MSQLYQHIFVAQIGHPPKYLIFPVVSIISFTLFTSTYTNYSISVDCGNPAVQSDDSVTVMVPEGQLVAGSNVNFTCPPGRVLIGHNTSTCMGNGQWHPGPKNVRCAGKTTHNGSYGRLLILFNIIAMKR